MKFKKHTLKNGLRIVLAPMRDTETVTILILTGTGSRYETRENNGVSHFLEHMFFKGTKRRPSALKISEELDAVGGEYNAYTSKDRTGYFAKVDSKHADIAIDVVSDIFLNSKIEKKELDRERGAILQELNMYNDMPSRHVWDIFEELLYGDEPLGREILGSKENIKKLSRKDLIDYFYKNYNTETTVIGVAGKFSQKDVLTKIRKEFSHLKKGTVQEFKLIKEDQLIPAFKIEEKTTDQTHVILGVRSYNMFHKNRYSLAVLATILGGGMSSRLFMEVREKRGLAYSVHADFEQYHDCGYLAAKAGVEHDNLEKTITTILLEFKKLKNKKVDAKELRKAKEYIKGKTIMGLEASDDVVSYLVTQEVMRGEIKKPHEFFEKIDRVTAGDIQKVAKEIFVSERLNCAIIGPHSKNSEKIRNLLKC